MAEATTSAGRTEMLRSLLDLLTACRFSWFSSVRPDGRPHSVPVWHVVHNGRMYVATKLRSVKAANVRANPNVSLAAWLDVPEAGLIVEGQARLAPELRGRVSPSFEQKYEWNIREDEEHDALIEVEPAKLIAWGEYGEGRWSGREIERAARGGAKGSRAAPQDLTKESPS
jgi:general stress protein 26